MLFPVWEFAKGALKLTLDGRPKIYRLYFMTSLSLKNFPGHYEKGAHFWAKKKRIVMWGKGGPLFSRGLVQSKNPQHPNWKRWVGGMVYLAFGRDLKVVGGKTLFPANKNKVGGPRG